METVFKMGNVPASWMFAAEKARELGFCAAGMAIASKVPTRASDTYRSWLDSDFHGQMAYLENWTEQRFDPRHPGILEAADVVFCVALPYGEGTCSEGLWRHVAGHARGRDYHLTMREMLNTLADTIRQKEAGKDLSCRVFVDTAPVMERTWAVLAGIGEIGRNGAVIVPGVGPKVVLGEIICRGTGPIHGDISKGGKCGPSFALCGDCTKCVDACPTGALRVSGLVDAVSCISYQTIENRNTEIPPSVAAKISSLFGCDICTAVCPHGNSNISCGLQPFEDSAVAQMELEDLTSLNKTQFKKRFRDTSLSRTGLHAVLRNLGFLRQKSDKKAL